VALQVAGDLSQLLGLLARRVGGPAVAHLLSTLEAALSIGPVSLEREEAGLTCNGEFVEGPLLDAWLDPLCATMDATGLRSIALGADVRERELLQFALLLHAEEGNQAFAARWQAFGSWHIRVVARAEHAASTERMATPPQDMRDASRPSHPANASAVLWAALRDASSGATRRRYYEALIAVGEGASILLDALGDRHWYVVRNAALLLGELRHLPADQALVLQLRHADARVRVAVVQALARLEGSVARSGIETATRDGAADVRRHAWIALGASSFPPPAACVDEALRHERSVLVFRALFQCLWRHPNPDVQHALLRCCARVMTLDSGGSCLCDGLELLAEFNPRSVTPFLRRLKGQGNARVRERIAQLKERVRRESAIGALPRH
jgi:hypothetical protein